MRRRKTARTILIAIPLLLAACARPTPYAPVADGGFGYSDHVLEEDRYRVEVRGNRFTPRGRVDDYLLYRAAELTIRAGGDHFVIVDRDTEARTTYRSWGGPLYAQRYDGPCPAPCYAPYDWRIRDPVVFDPVTRYRATAEIVVRRGPKPEDTANAYDARTIRKRLESRLLRPGRD